MVKYHVKIYLEKSNSMETKFAYRIEKAIESD